MEFAEVTIKESPGLCRCCLSEGCYKDLGSEYTWMNDTEIYADMLLDCFDIGITQHNDGPNGRKRLICEVCITRLRDACNFKRQVVDSERKFIDMLGRGEFRTEAKDTVYASVPVYETPLKAEAIEEVTLTEDYESNVEYLDDMDNTEDDEPVKSEPPPVPVPSTSTSAVAKRGRPKKADSGPPEKKAKLKPKVIKLPKEVDLETEQHLAALLISIIQDSSIVPFRWHKGKFMCFYCSASFNQSSDLREHNKRGHEEINITEIVTKVMYIDGRIKLDMENAKCNLCNELIVDITQYIQHLLVHDTYFDPDIAKFFTSFKLSEDLSCIECGQDFLFFGSLNMHTNKNHVEKYMCELCGCGIVGKLSIYNHMKQHTVKSCKYCEETFPTQYALFNHISKKHKNSLTCTLCGEKQQNHYKLKRHMALEHDCKSLQIVCEYCSKVFTRNNKYVQHKQRVHFKQKNVECPECRHSTFDAESLKNHMVCHEELKPYTCVCGKIFRRSRNLAAHQKICSEISILK